MGAAMSEARDQTGHKVAIYVKYVESAVKVLDQRIAMNNAFWAANLAATAAVLWALRDQTVQRTIVAFALVFMIALCLFWLKAVMSLRALSATKFDVVHDLEKDLPSDPFTREWGNLQKVRYTSLTRVEMSQISVVVAFYFVTLIYTLFYR